MDKCFSVLLEPGNIPCLRPHYCAPNIGNYIFSPDGCIYTCWEEIGLEHGRIGMYAPKLEWNEGLAQEWVSRYVSNMPECLNCAYALICGGGCAKQARKLSGKILSPYCNQFKETFERVVPSVFREYMRRHTKTEYKKDETDLCV